MVTVREQRAARVEMDAFRREAAGRIYAGLAESDIEPVRRWRNAQLDVLRQTAPLSAAQQARWFREVVLPTHASSDPAFLLVGIHRGGRLVGYGGLVHISWVHRRAEVSFLVDPAIAGDAAAYRDEMLAYLGFATDWAFGDLGLHRLHTEAFAFRGPTIAILEEAGFRPEGRLREHVADPHAPGGFVDSVIHGLLASDPRPGGAP